MSEEKEILLGYLIGSISILRDMHIQFTEKSRNKLADKIMELLTVYEKQQKEIEELKKPKYLLNAKTGEITTINNSEFISNDKIKSKIEELEIEQESNREDLKIAIDNLSFQNIDKIVDKISINMSVREILQSLLEKE